MAEWKGFPTGGKDPGRMGQKVLSDPSGLGSLLQAGDEGLQWWEHPCNPSQRAKPPAPAPRCENSGCSSKKFPLTGLGLSIWELDIRTPAARAGSSFHLPRTCTMPTARPHTAPSSQK